MKLSDRTYDILKAIYEILVLLAAFYVDIADIWNLPYGEQIVGTITAIDTFMGVLLKLSSNEYYKGLHEQDK